MRKLLKYKGYYGSVEYSSEDVLLYGKVLGINSLISYEGESVAEMCIRDRHRTRCRDRGA